MSRKGSNRRAAAPTEHTLLDEMTASPTQPLSLSKREHQLDQIRAGIEAMRTAPSPTRNDWCVIADLVNLLETLVEMGEVNDDGGWITEAAREMAIAARRSVEVGVLRLTGSGLNAVSNAFDGYELALSELPARTLVRAHRKTELRMREVRAGRGRRADVQVVML